jgi:hypothetical protein
MLVYIQNYTTGIRIVGRNILFSEHFCKLFWQIHTHTQMLHKVIFWCFFFFYILDKGNNFSLFSLNILRKYYTAIIPLLHFRQAE